MRYFVLVVTTLKPFPQDEGLNFNITFLARSKASATRRFRRCFPGFMLISIS